MTANAVADRAPFCSLRPTTAENCRKTFPLMKLHLVFGIDFQRGRRQGRSLMINPGDADMSRDDVVRAVDAALVTSAEAARKVKARNVPSSEKQVAKKAALEAWSSAFQKLMFWDWIVANDRLPFDKYLEFIHTLPHRHRDSPFP